MAGPSPNASPAARRGRRVAWVLFFGVLIWVCLAGSVQILGEALFRKKVPRSAEQCRLELDLLRSRLADASMRPPEQSELASVEAFRAALGGPRGRDFDLRVLELIDGCPKEEADAAYAVARLRAANEAIIRIDALEVAPARRAYMRAFGGLSPAAPAAPTAVPAPSGSTSTSSAP